MPIRIDVKHIGKSLKTTGLHRTIDLICFGIYQTHWSIRLLCVTQQEYCEKFTVRSKTAYWPSGHFEVTGILIFNYKQAIWRRM